MTSWDSLPSKKTFSLLGDRIPGVDVRPVLAETSRAEERIQRAADKYLKRFDPPRAAVFGGFAYAPSLQMP